MRKSSTVIFNGKTGEIFEEIRYERQRQDKIFGEQNHQMVYDGFDVEECKKTLEIIRRCNKKAGKIGKDNWYYILAEEFLEAFAETDPEKQREEMIHAAAVAVNIIEYLDRRMGNESNT